MAGNIADFKSCSGCIRAALATFDDPASVAPSQVRGKAIDIARSLGVRDVAPITVSKVCGVRYKMRQRHGELTKELMAQYLPGAAPPGPTPSDGAARGGTKEDPRSPSGAFREAFALQDDPENAEMKRVAAVARSRYVSHHGGDPNEVTLGIGYSVKQGLRRRYGRPITKEKLAHYLDPKLAPPPSNGQPRIAIVPERQPLPPEESHRSDDRRDKLRAARDYLRLCGSRDLAVQMLDDYMDEVEFLKELTSL